MWKVSPGRELPDVMRQGMLFGGASDELESVKELVNLVNGKVFDSDETFCGALLPVGELLHWPSDVLYLQISALACAS